MKETGTCCSLDACCQPEPDKTPRIRDLSTTWSWRDRLSTWGVRWGFRRMAYRVQPGLYRVGEPDDRTPVMVTANYKLSLDMLRRELTGRNAWILVLNTHGINVWCAAGKGTFGTDELVKRIRKHKLTKVVSHRTLVLPQLGAPGVAAHDIRLETGFIVRYGPVRASDVPAYLDNHMMADETMRTVTFTLRERVAVLPVELVQALKVALLPMLILAAAALLPGTDPSTTAARSLEFLGAIGVGTVAFPVLLPVFPFRSFALGGLALGFAYAALLLFIPAPAAWLSVRLLVFPPLVSWLALNFTGATTFTSLSGVQKELGHATIPLGITAVTGLLLSTGLFLKGWLS